jgi:pyruvate/2-oxoglutarate dehydrogenase complex dihydrolipoamide acyltransferase (E2) component
MKKLFTAAILAAVLAGPAFAQSAPAQAAQTPADASSTQAAAGAAAAPPQTANAPAPAATAPAAANPSEPAAANQADAAPAPAPSAPARERSYLEQELESAASELSSGTVGNLTVDDLEKVAEHLAIAVQKERYVQRARNASFMLPGLGQFMTGDTLGGWLFVAWDVTVLAGTLLSAYFVLPANVQFASLDYLNSPLSTVRSAWASNSIIAYLPLAGVLAGGVILETVLRYVSADNAANTARRNIDQGKVTFQPTLDLADGGLGLGMKMTY